MIMVYRLDRSDRFTLKSGRHPMRQDLTQSRRSSSSISQHRCETAATCCRCLRQWESTSVQRARSDRDNSIQNSYKKNQKDTKKRPENLITLHFHVGVARDAVQYRHMFMGCVSMSDTLTRQIPNGAQLDIA